MRFLLALALAGVASAQPLQFMALKEGVLEERLKLAHPKNSVRYERLKSLFEQAGCSGGRFHEQRVRGSKEANMICEVAGAGESRRKIVVGAHFDCNGGEGIIDNWSGAVMLPSLSEFLGRGSRRHSFEFVAFTAEEKGLLGSRAYLKSIPKEERKQIAAAITVDSIGLTPAKCWPNGSSKELVAAAAAVARALKVDFAGVNVDRVGTTDSQVFKDARIPVLSLHSVAQETWRVINGSRDAWANVSWKDYYDTHRLISALLVYLDRSLP